MSKYYMYNGRFYSEEELTHAFKYIKREKKNGKWVYTYDLGRTEKEAYEKAQADYERSRDNYYEKSDRYYRKQESYVNSTWDGESGPTQDAAYSAMKRAYNETRPASEKMKENRKACEETLAKYKETPLYKLEQASSSVKKGLKKVSNFFSKLFSK